MLGSEISTDTVAICAAIGVVGTLIKGFVFLGGWAKTIVMEMKEIRKDFIESVAHNSDRFQAIENKAERHEERLNSCEPHIQALEFRTAINEKDIASVAARVDHVHILLQKH